MDAYLAAFRKTPLVMLIGGGDMLKAVYDLDNNQMVDSSAVEEADPLLRERRILEEETKRKRTLSG